MSVQIQSSLTSEVIQAEGRFQALSEREIVDESKGNVNEWRDARNMSQSFVDQACN